MPLQNRVTPLGELVADPARGLVYGNRGCLHDAERADPAALQRQALDRVPARVPRLAARAAAAAGPLHGALLPRRGDGVRRRSPPVRALPPRGLRPLRRDLARARPRADERRRDRRAAPRRAARRRREQRQHDGGARRAAGRRVRPARRRAVARARATSCSRWTPAGYAERTPRPARSAGDADHAAVARRRAARGLGARRAAPAPDRHSQRSRRRGRDILRAMGFFDKAKAAAGQAAAKAKQSAEDLQLKVDLGSAYDDLGKAAFELIERARSPTRSSTRRPRRCASCGSGWRATRSPTEAGRRAASRRSRSTRRRQSRSRAEPVGPSPPSA